MVHRAIGEVVCNQCVTLVAINSLQSKNGFDTASQMQHNNGQFGALDQGSCRMQTGAIVR